VISNTSWATISRLSAYFSQLKYKGYVNFWTITNIGIEKSKGDNSTDIHMKFKLNN